MKHFICRGGCGGESDKEGSCQTSGCPSSGKPLEVCDCEDGKHVKTGAEEIPGSLATGNN